MRTIVGEECGTDRWGRVQNLLALYDRPIEFWLGVLGPEMHFHVGHFICDSMTLKAAQRSGVDLLIRDVGMREGARVLDVGCGWGGPAFQLVNSGAGEVLGLTISGRQAEFVNEKAERLRVPVRALRVDVEEFDFRHIGTFDILWLYEVLEHIENRERLFGAMAEVAQPGAMLAISVACRSRRLEREAFSFHRSGALELLAIQPLDTADELVASLKDNGWRVIVAKDHTPRTLPTWERQLDGLAAMVEPKYKADAARFSEALRTTAEQFNSGVLEAWQFVAQRPPKGDDRVLWRGFLPGAG
jgi:cyclopropane fatty-acyl-phospholipid synthase-like methyltransferase